MSHLHGVESDRKNLRKGRIRLNVEDTPSLITQNTMNGMGSPLDGTGQAGADEKNVLRFLLNPTVPSVEIGSPWQRLIQRMMIK